MDTYNYRFNLFSLSFTPFKEDRGKKSSNDILRSVINYLFELKNEGKGHLIDRYKNRPEELPRELFMTSMVYVHKDKKIRCSIALLRKGKKPKIKPSDQFSLVPIEEIGGEIAEETHFYIDYSRDVATLCVEFNKYGPRASDIEFYLRSVAYDKLKEATATKMNMYMDSPIEETLENLKKVLSFDMKVAPSSFVQMDKDLVGEYFSGINNFGNVMKPDYIKIESSFYTQNDSVSSSSLDTPSNRMIQKLLKRFVSRPFHIDCFQNFVVKYEDNQGNEEVFNLLKGKKEILVEIEDSNATRRKVYERVKPYFDEFIKSL